MIKLTSTPLDFLGLRRSVAEESGSIDAIQHFFSMLGASNCVVPLRPSEGPSHPDNWRISFWPGYESKRGLCSGGRRKAGRYKPARD